MNTYSLQLKVMGISLKFSVKKDTYNLHNTTDSCDIDNTMIDKIYDENMDRLALINITKGLY